MKKYVLILSLFFLSTASFAADSPLPMGSLPSQVSDGATQAIAALEKFIGELYTQGNTWEIAQNYQPIPNLEDMKHTNTTLVAIGDATNLSPTEAANIAASNITSNNLFDTLQQSTYAMYEGDDQVTKNLKTAAGKPFSDYMNDNSALSLSGIPGTDTLYVRGMAGEVALNTLFLLKSQNYKDQLKEPDKKPNSDYLDFSTLITPASYTEDELKNVNRFLVFATRNTENLTSGINFSELHGKPMALFNLKQNPQYQNYLLTMRNLLAQRTITLSALNQLIGERTPIQNLGVAAGMPPTDPEKNTYPSASPLQVESYRANHRLTDPHWYQSVQNASPATVQRELLIVLAEIEHQNYEAHLDRERLLAAIAGLNIMNSTQLEKVTALQEVPNVNAAIKAALGEGDQSTATPPPAQPDVGTSLDGKKTS